MYTHIVLNRCIYLLVMSLIAFGCKTSATNDSDPLEALTKTHTRVVWVQDHGKGVATLGFGKNFKLMGYDSRDGKKERPLLDEIDSFYKPILTPDGKKVVVSNHKQKEIYIIDFKSGKRQSLGQGIAIEVWQDPATGKIWVYAFAGKGKEFKSGTTRPLIRFPLKHPKKRELVWKKTFLSYNNFDLSRDGKFAGGLFPWPKAGILSFGDKSWNRYGKGCWTALSPDNSSILWVFDGLHRNLNFVKPDTDQFWTTNINTAPGINGYEVYHPRWSNHVRLMTMTGPYVEGEGGNKIRGGGKKVEIYLGKFSVDLKSVDSWLQVTDNDRADFFPDVWLANGNKSTLDLPQPNTGAPAKTTQATKWPVTRDHLVYIWQNISAENKLPEESLVGFAQLGVNPKHRARFNRFLEMDLHGSGFIASWPFKKAMAALGKKDGFGIEFLYTPEATAADIAGPVIRLKSRNRDLFNVRQKGNNLILEIADGKMPPTRLELPNFLHPHRPEHLFIAFHKKQLQIYTNGRLLKKAPFTSNPISSLNDGQLLFGQPEMFNSGINGTLSHVGLYAERLSEQEIMKNAHLVTGALEERSLIDTIRFKGKVIESSIVPDPESLGAYRRALVVNRYQITDQLTEGYADKEILVAQWAVLDRTILPEAKDFTNGKLVEMNVEKFDLHPELEGERLIMDMFDPDREIYYQVDS
ncbi:MAG: hypothetical protein KJO32_17050 [Deltaproteobacteria bacterium]|nr:hypothetical protein [Deltaproteobacteria bacterium]